MAREVELRTAASEAKVTRAGSHSVGPTIAMLLVGGMANRPKRPVDSS